MIPACSPLIKELQSCLRRPFLAVTKMRSLPLKASCEWQTLFVRTPAPLWDYLTWWAQSVCWEVNRCLSLSACTSLDQTLAINKSGRIGDIQLLELTDRDHIKNLRPSMTKSHMTNWNISCLNRGSLTTPAKDGSSIFFSNWVWSAVSLLMLMILKVFQFTWFYEFNICSEGMIYNSTQLEYLQCNFNVSKACEMVSRLGK